MTTKKLKREKKMFGVCLNKEKNSQRGNIFIYRSTKSLFLLNIRSGETITFPYWL